MHWHGCMALPEREHRAARPGSSGVAPRNALHWPGGAARCVGAHFRGLPIPQGAVPGRAPGFGHMAPTYLCRFPGSASYGRRGSALNYCMTSSTRVEDLKAALRQGATALRDALPAHERKAAAETIAARKFPLAISLATTISG